MTRYNDGMFLVGMVTWWYGEGWKGRLSHSAEAIRSIAQFFSIGTLAATLFSPFRQISAGKVSGPLGVQMRAFFDRVISRFIGAVIRTVFIFAGIITIIFGAFIQLIASVVWLFVPLFPIVGCFLVVIEWMPWK